jgi:hypothetical protein
VNSVAHVKRGPSDWAGGAKRNRGEPVKRESCKDSFIVLKQIWHQAMELGGADTRLSENAIVDRRYLTWHLLGTSWGPRPVACGERSRL